MCGGIGTDGGDETVVVLFYCYQGLGAEGAAQLAEEQQRLGAELRLSGRVLVALEGINGTVQGGSAAVTAYEVAVQRFFNTRIDWKRSAASEQNLFPDFVVKQVSELVGFGLQEAKPLDVHAEGGTHLSPEEFHSRLLQNSEELRIIDVRNTFEYDVGHFDGAIDPGMTHTAQWPRYVKDNIQDLRGRTVMLYCTGGIRCEKASAYLRRRLNDLGDSSTPVFQLEGGIHRYLEAFPDGGHFQGANFVFDKRAQMRSASTSVVGRCSECSSAWDTHHGGRVCAVCRALVLVCDACDATSSGEYWCPEHSEMKGIYHHFLDRFTAEELQLQAGALQSCLAKEVGTRKKNRRNTLRKKLTQVEARLAVLTRSGACPGPPIRRCRACERPYSECPGSCWGFWRRTEPE
ncbi:Tstd2 [Symbiodinium sp. CCMP2592]|nr:Tstd2 [Symbiodinium sp. CCMP2592]